MKSIVCILLLAAISCDTLLKLEMHLENQTRDLTANIKSLELRANETVSVNDKGVCKNTPSCSEQNCQKVQRSKVVRWTENKKFGFWDSKPKLRNDPAGWNCKQITKFVFEWGCKDNIWIRPRSRTENYQITDPNCDKPITIASELKSIDGLSMELSDADHQCQKQVTNTSEIIRCRDIALTCEWTAHVVEGNVAEDIKVRSEYEVDLDFALDGNPENKTLIRYNVDSDSEQLRWTGSNRLSDGKTNPDMGSHAWDLIEGRIQNLIAQVSFNDVISADPVHNENTPVVGQNTTAPN